MATHSRILAWGIPLPGQRILAGYIVHGVAKNWTHLKRLSTHSLLQKGNLTDNMAQTNESVYRV